MGLFKQARPSIFLWIILDLLVLGVGGALIFLKHSPATLHNQKKQVESPYLSEIKQSDRYHYLRDINMLGNHFVMLQHQPTHQRLILLMGGGADQETAYQKMYQKNLSVMEFSLLFKLFKHQSPHNKQNILITHVSLQPSGEIHQNTFRLLYKPYEVETMVEGKPEMFKAYVGELEVENHTKGLLFTYNHQTQVSLAPYTDLLKVLKQPSKTTS